MRTIRKYLLYFLLCVSASAGSLSGQDGRQILKAVDDMTYAPADQVSTSTITLIDRNGNESVRKAMVWQKGMHMRLTRFLEPASQRGISFLSLPGDVMYIYLPAFGNERRIAPHVKNQSFAGTDFSYEDMEAVPYSEKFDPRFLESLDGKHILELTPRQGIRSDYSKLVITVNPDNDCVEKIDFYNRGGIHSKQLLSRAEKIGSYWSNTHMEMTDLLNDHKTMIRISDIRFDSGLDDEEFTVRKIKQIL